MLRLWASFWFRRRRGCLGSEALFHGFGVPGVKIEGLLGGSWEFIRGVITRVTGIISHVGGLITPFMATAKL